MAVADQADQTRRHNTTSQQCTSDMAPHTSDAHSRRTTVTVALPMRALRLRLLAPLLLLVALLLPIGPLGVAAQTRLSGLTTTAASMVPSFAAATTTYNIDAVFATSTVRTTSHGTIQRADRGTPPAPPCAHQLRNVGSQ